MSTEVRDSQKSKRERAPRERGRTTITSKNQVTIPVAVLRAAGLESGDRVSAHADGEGRIYFERVNDPWDEFIGVLTGDFDRAAIEALRDEWDR